MAAVRVMLNYLDIDVNDKKFEDKVTMPKLKALREEYPSNNVIKAIMNACPPKMRVWVMAMLMAGLEPTDAMQLAQRLSL